MSLPMHLVAADIGGTFTDCIVTTAAGERRTMKVLSSGLVSAEVMEVHDDRLILEIPQHFSRDQFWIGGRIRSATIRDWRELDKSVPHRTTVECRLDSGASVGFSKGQTVSIDGDVEAPVLAARLLLDVPLTQPMPPTRVRLGTTRGTNALLTRTGAATALLLTEGFGDLLEIGTQDRPELFNLDIHKPQPLARWTIEIPGRLDASGNELKPIDAPEIRRKLMQLKQQPVKTVAICLLHAHRNAVHEQAVEKIAREVGFERVICSSRVAPLARVVPRAETTTLDAYLQPVLEDYVTRVEEQLGGSERCHLRWMTSGGNLVSSVGFRGRQSVLSGPAGGVVALAEIARRVGSGAAVGLDMGGTSTDVSRFEGSISRRNESIIAGVRVLAPMMDIHTIAAGGGSVCSVRDGRLFVGPESAGADPGPACYGRGGPLTVTDVNVLLKRLRPERFPFSLDVAASERALAAVHQSLTDPTEMTTLELASGFLQIAVTQMAEAVRVVSTAAGSDVRKMMLVGFGAAAGGHLCRVADSLGITHIVDHPEAGLLSAVGIENASIGRIGSRGIESTIAPSCIDSHRIADQDALQRLQDELQLCRRQTLQELATEESIDLDVVPVEVAMSVDCRYAKTQSTLKLSVEPIDTLPTRLDQLHQRTFGYDRPTMPIEVVAVECEVTVPKSGEGLPSVKEIAAVGKQHRMESRFPMWVEGAWHDVPTVDRSEVDSGDWVDGPAIVTSDHSVLVVEPGWRAVRDAEGWMELKRVECQAGKPDVRVGECQAGKPDVRVGEGQTGKPDVRVVECQAGKPDVRAVELEVATRRIQGIAEAMGEVIRRTSVSVNVKERRDYSCAVFLGDGSLIANAPHVPVHLGAMGHTVRGLMKAFPVMFPGDCYLSNDPMSGGSHLPDVTTVTPVFCDESISGASIRPTGWVCDFFVASRCHHAEIGGIVPGSMAPAATCLAEEGVLIRNFALVRDGIAHHEALRELLSTSPYPSRSVDENMADIAAAEAAGLDGASAIMRLADSMTTAKLHGLMARLLDVAGDATAQWISSLGAQVRTFADSLDDGTPVVVKLVPDPILRTLTIDFTGTGGVHRHGFNATRSIVTAAVLYVLRCVCPSELPLCDGVLRRIDLVIPPGLLDPPGSDDPWACPAVVAGNVETSNRVVDVMLGALQAAAASQGTMNNLLMGDATLGYYETIGGGAGATGNGPGADAVHTHMTNTRITDPEVLESRLPVRLWRFGVRRGSGGAGRHAGGDGMIREIEFLRPLTMSLITSRRNTRPYGLAGGTPGQSGEQVLLTKSGERRELPFAITMEVSAGDRLVIQTPGGGGWGSNW